MALTRQAVLDEAIRTLDAYGFADLSMRKLAGALEVGHDRGGDDVAGGEVGQRVDAGHDPPAVRVHQDRPLPTHRLADQHPALLGAGVPYLHFYILQSAVAISRVVEALRQKA